MKKVLFLVRAAPYGMATGGEAFRAIVSAAGMDLKTSAVLVDDGVLIAKKGHQPDRIGMTNLEAPYAQLGQLGVKLYIHRESAQQRSLENLQLIEAQWISTIELKLLINNADAVISFT